MNTDEHIIKLKLISNDIDHIKNQHKDTAILEQLAGLIEDINDVIINIDEKYPSGTDLIKDVFDSKFRCPDCDHEFIIKVSNNTKDVICPKCGNPEVYDVDLA